MYGYIYKTTNLINGKIYIGQKMSNIFLKEEYLGSGKYLRNAINKYGKENFEVELIEWCETFEKINEREKYWIQYFNSLDKEIGYNISVGGDGGDTWKGLSEDDKYIRKEKLKESMPNQKGWKIMNNGITVKKVPPQNIYNYINEGWVFGYLNKRKSFSENHKKSISEKHKGRMYINKDGKEKQIYPHQLDEFIADGWIKGRDLNSMEKTIEKIRGRTVSEEGRKNMSLAHLNSKQKTQKGYKTINNGSEEKHVPQENLDKYLDNGWILGRLPITEEHRKNLSKSNKGQISWCKGFKYITNGEEEKRVNVNDVSKYIDLGWWLGRLPADKR